MRLVAVWAAVLACGSAAAPSQAEGAERFRLRWAAAASCPAERQVQAETERLLGASKLPTSGIPLEVDARVAETSRGFELELTLGQGAEARLRLLAAPTCLELGRAAALVIALAIDPSLRTEDGGQSAGALGAAGMGAGAEQVAPSPCPEPSIPEPPPAPALPAPSPAPPRCPIVQFAPPLESLRPKPGHYALLAGSGFAYGALPQALPRASLGAAYRSGTHWLELSADAAFASSGPRTDGSGATFLLGLAAPRYCERTQVGLIALGACAVLEVGALSASGFGVTRPKTQLSAWFAAGVGLQFSAPLAADAEIRIGADLLLVATRTRFQLDSEPFYRSNPVVPAVRLALAAGIL